MNKTGTGVKGLDTILYGGYLTGKPTLISGDPGTGKTIMTLLFTHHILSKSEPVLYITFDESSTELTAHMKSLSLDGHKLLMDNLFFIDITQQLDETVSGSFDMLALISRASYLIKKHNIKHLVVDSIQSVRFGKTKYSPSDELLKLFKFARAENITLIATLGEGILDKDGLLAKFSVDCLIELKQVVDKMIMTRFLRVLKFRGSKHGTNIYPFSIHSKGISLLPITSAHLTNDSKAGFISSGIKKLDHILGKKGIPLESSTMISGRSGTAKTSIAASIAESACKSGLKVCFLSFEESPADLIKHMESVNIKLAPHVKSKKLYINSVRSVEQGLEEHIISIIDFIKDNNIDLIIIDPITAFMDIGDNAAVKGILLRFVSYVKERRITAVFTELIPDYSNDKSLLSISSLTDVWIRLRLIPEDGEYYRALYVVKARGLAQSHEIKEMKISHKGIELLDPYISEGNIIFGAKKKFLEMQDKMTEEELQEAKKKLAVEIDLLQAKKENLEKQRQLHFSQKQAYRKSRE